MKGSHIKKVAFQQWSIIDQRGEKIWLGKRGLKLPSRLDVWLMMESPVQLDLEVVLTNDNLEKKGKPPVTKGKLVAWKGVTILFTHVHCRNQRACWDTKSPFKYVDAFDFGRTGMSRNQ